MYSNFHFWLVIFQFLGIWYAVQKTTTASTCIIYNITESDEPGEYNIEQVSQHFALGLTPLKHAYSYTGTLKVIDRDLPAKMSVKYPLSVAGSSKFTVFGTDYTTYAGIFTCQKLAFSHRQSATILSRSKTLDKIYVDKVFIYAIYIFIYCKKIILASILVTNGPF